MPYRAIGIALVAMFIGIGIGAGSSGSGDLKAQVATAAKHSSDLGSQVSSLSGQLSSIKSQLSGKDSLISTLQSQNSTLQDANDQLTAQVADLKGKVKAASEPKPVPNGRGITIDLAQWQGLFKVQGATMKYSYGYAEVLGTIEYLGGGSCDLTYVELSATFYKGGKIIGQGLWNTLTISQGHAIPIDVSGETGSFPDRAEVVMTSASC